MRKRLLAALIALVMVIGLVPGTALAAENSNEYIKFEYDYGAAALRDNEITVIVQDDTGKQLGNPIVISDFYSGVTTDVTITSLNSNYEIYAVERTSGSANITLPDNQGSVFSCNIYSELIQGEGTITVTLGKPFEDPDIQGDKIDRVSINYEAYIPALLKLLHVNGVENVDKNTEIEGVSIHFVEEYAYSADWEFELMPSGADNLAYYYPRGGALSTAGGDNTPYNIRYLEITYTQNDGEKQTCRVDSKDLRYVNVGGNTYEIEANNDNEYIVAFYWEKDLSQMVWTFYDVRFVDANTPLGKENMPEDPVYPENITSFTFTNWSEGVKGETPFLPYENVTDDKVVYAQRVSSEYGGTRIRVDNTDDIMLKRFIEIYNAENDANITSVDRDSIRIQVNGTDLDGNEGNTNPNYWNNEWVGDYEYYRVVNSHIVGNHERISNTHIKHDGMKSITIYAKINGSQEISVEIPVDNNVVGGVHFTQDGTLDNVAWIYFNAPPGAPSEEEIIGTPPDGLLGKDAVTVDCVNDKIDPAHGDATYGLLDGSFTPPTEDDIQWAAGEGEGDFGYYYIDLEVSSAKYIEKYNETTSGHKLAEEQDETQTIRLICKEFDNTTGEWVWEVQTKTPITFQVICETPESGYDITGITKELVEREDDLPTGVTQGEDGPFKFPDENGIVVISASEGSTTSFVNLLYKITVTGKEGAEFTVTDAGAKLVSPEDDTITEQKDPIDGNNTFSGTIPEGGEAVFYVSKMFSADGLVADEDSSTGTVLKNTATVKTDDEDSVDEDNDEATEETPAAEAQTIYTYIQFIGNGENGTLTEDDKAYIEETYGKAVDEWGYLPIGNFDAPLPDPTEEPYAPTGGQGTGGDNFKKQFLEQIKPYITDEYYFEWVDGLDSSKFDLANGVDWIKLSVANGATSIDNTVTGYCWHLDGRIQLYAPDIDVTKALTKINDTEYAAGTDAMVEVGDTLTWTITVTNEGNKEATGLTLSDTLTADGAERQLTSLTKDGDTTWMTDSTFDVPAATTEGPSAVTFTATYVVTDADKGLTLSNTATVSDGDDETEDPSGETDNPVAERKVEITKELTKVGENPYDGTSMVNVGDKLTYEIKVTNTGNVALENVVVEDTLTVDDTPVTEGVRLSCTDTDVKIEGTTATIENLAVGGTVTITATYTVKEADAEKKIVNTATVSGDDIDDGDGGEEEVTVANPAVKVEKELTSATRDGQPVYDSTTGSLENYKAQVGDVLSYTITVTNTGNTTLENVTIKDSLWVGTEYAIKVNGTDDNYAGADGFTIKSGIAVGDSVTITYTYTVTEADALKESISNSVDVYLDSTEPGGGEDPDGEDDVTVKMDDYTIDIAPADIVIYTGGTGYAGVLQNENGDLLNQPTSGLPEPGYHIELPEAVEKWLNSDASDEDGARNLAEVLSFIYNADGEQRAWDMEYQGIYSLGADGNPDRFVYSLETTQEGQDPVRLQISEEGSDTFVTNDKFEMTEDTAHKTYQMSIYGGALDLGQVKAVFTVEDEDGTEKTITCNVNVEPGELIIKGVTDPDDVTTNAIAANGDAVADGTLAAVDNGNVDYYVNETKVEIEDTDRVQLLVDSVSNDDSFNQNMENDAISKVTGLSDAQAQSYYLDLVDTQNGNAVVTMGDNDELTIYWPMPADADPNGDFYIVHYDEMDRTDTDMQTTAPEVKEASVTQDGDHLTFTTDSFSPFVLVYEKKADTPPYNPPIVDPDPEPTPDPDLEHDPEGLNTEDHVSYLIGYEDGTIRPEADITRAEVATIFFRLLEDEVRDANYSTTNNFPDVNVGDWFNTAVSTLTGMDKIIGYEDGTFRPNEPITRAEFVTIATRFYNHTAEYKPGTFPDVDEDDWYADYIQAAVDMDLILGDDDGTFRPNDPITRAEAAAIVNRMLGRRPHEDHLLPEEDMNMWPDNSQYAWYYKDIQEATNTHDYDWIVVEDESDGDYRTVEDWTAKEPDPDWVEIEQGWAAAKR